VGQFHYRNPLPLQTWAHPIHEKDIDDQDSGFGSMFWPFWIMLWDLAEKEEQWKRQTQHAAQWQQPA
jgi:hypothetical protein